MKIIHWEYNKNLIGQQDTAIPVTRIGATIDSETGKAIGIYVLWKYLLQKGDQVCFNCICQDNYIISNLPGFDIGDLKALLYKSYGKFKGALLERLDVMNFSVIPQPYEIQEDRLQQVVTELSRLC